MGDRRPASFYWLAALFTLFVLFLYGPMITIVLLSFQGPGGGLTFPMNGVSTYWFSQALGGRAAQCRHLGRVSDARSGSASW